MSRVKDIYHSQEARGRFDFAFCPLRGVEATFVSTSRYSFYWEDRSGSFGRAAHREVPKKRLHIAGEPERPSSTPPAEPKDQPEVFPPFTRSPLKGHLSSFLCESCRILRDIDHK